MPTGGQRSGPGPRRIIMMMPGFIVGPRASLVLRLPVARPASGTPGLSSMAVPTPWHWRGCQRTPRPLAVVIVSPSHRACQAVPPVFRCTLHARTGGWQLGTELAAFPEAAVKVT